MDAPDNFMEGTAKKAGLGRMLCAIGRHDMRHAFVRHDREVNCFIGICDTCRKMTVNGKEVDPTGFLRAIWKAVRSPGVIETEIEKP